MMIAVVIAWTVCRSGARNLGVLNLVKMERFTTKPLVVVVLVWRIKQVQG